MLPKKDLLILANLRNNARESLTTMSKKTSIPVSTIYDKIRLHQKGLIKKHTTLIDFGQLGFHTRANILIKMEREEREKAKDFLVKHHHVNSVYKISSGFDYLVEAIFKNVKDVEDFMDVLQDRFKILQTQIYYVVEDLKNEAFMDTQELLDVIIS